MLRSCWYDRFPKVCLAATALGIASGCFIPGGGWTLRTGLDWRTHAKPGAYLELVDTRWDEWNRIAQLNSMMAADPYPVVGEVTPAPAASEPPAQQPPQNPPPIPPAPGISAAIPEYPRLDSRAGNKPRRPGRPQVAGRPSTTPQIATESPAVSVSTDRRSERGDVLQSSWDAPPEPANRPAVTKPVAEKMPPGGWLFRAVRR